MSTLLCINGQSRDGQCDLGAIKEKLGSVGPVIECRLTDGGDPNEILEGQGRSIERIVVGGGDGTVHRMLPTPVAADRPCGVLPLGTANDFARSLELPLDPVAAVDPILEGHTRRVELGEVNGTLFVNAVGIGLGPELTRQLDSEHARRLGVAAYFSELLRVLRKQRYRPAALTIDHQRHRIPFMQITIANGVHYGGGMTIADDADLADGWLRVLCVMPQSILKLLSHFVLLRWGKMTGLRYDRITLYRGREVSVTTRHVQDVTADGELVSKTPVTCRSAAGVIEVYAPGDS